MQAHRVHRFGPPEVITLESIETPLPAAGEVLVQVHAAVGPWDAWIRAGQSKLPQPLPLTLGSDLAGVVAALGPGVTDLAVGQRVYGVTNARFTGAYAEAAVARAAMLAPAPVRLGDVEAAALPVVAVTAWQLLFDHARLAPGQTVLIHGGGGSVGALAVQLAHRHGARVVATASAGELDEVRALGADLAIDYRGQRFEELATAVDAVVDTVGGETQRRSFAVLRRGGVLVSAVSAPDAGEAERHGVRATFMMVDVTRERLTDLAARFDAGTLRSRIGVALPFGDAVKAHRMLDGVEARPRGKIVLRVAG